MAENPLEAEKLLLPLLKQDPSNSLVLSSLGYTYYKMENLDTASYYYDSLLLLNPYDEEALYNRSVIALQRGESDFVLASLSTLSESRATTLTSLIEESEALSLLEKQTLLKNNLSYEGGDTVITETFSETVEIMRKRGEYREAITLLDSLLEKEEGAKVEADYFFLKGDILITELGLFSEGEKLLKEAKIKGFDDLEAIKELKSRLPFLYQSQLDEIF